MGWNPEIYNKFKSERSQPFYDLLEMVKVRKDLSVIDLGCGTGELTRQLADHLPGSYTTGIDSSNEMLREAANYTNNNLVFSQASIEEFVQGKNKYDLIFSNAALQWVDDHTTLLPALIRLLNSNGQLAVQVPSNHHHFTHATLAAMAAEAPYQQALKGWNREIAVLTPEDYARLFFEQGAKEITVYEKIYPHVLKNAEAVFEWTSATAMLRYTERLPEKLKEDFISEYKNRLLSKYENEAPVFYPFKRILMSAVF